MIADFYFLIFLLKSWKNLSVKLSCKKWFFFSCSSFFVFFFAIASIVLRLFCHGICYCFHLQRDTIIEIFYEKHLGQLIDIITASCPTEGFQSTKKIEGAGVILGDTNSVKPEILSNICELLCFCVLQHPYRIK